MKSWIIWAAMCRLTALLFMMISLAAAVTAVILLVREGLVEKLIKACGTEPGRRLGLAAALAVFVWVLVIGKSALAMENPVSGKQEAGAAAATEPAQSQEPEAADQEKFADTSASSRPEETGNTEASENARTEEPEDTDPSGAGRAQEAGSADSPESADLSGAADSSGTAEPSGIEEPSDTADLSDPADSGQPGTEDSAEPSDSEQPGTAGTSETAQPQEPEITDTEAPSVQIRMSEEVNRDASGTAYCRSDNAGITVTIEDRRETDTGIRACTVTVTDSEGNRILRNWVKGENEETEEETEISVETEETAGLCDGEITVYARAEDLAGNSEEEELSLILDTQAPVLREIMTVSGGPRDSASGELTDGSAAEGILYDDSDLYYNDRELTTMIAMEDENGISWEISYLELPGIGTSSGENSIERRKAGTGKRGSISVSSEGIYGDWRIGGEDTAGNRLQADPDCRCSKDAEGFFEKDGDICLPGRKIIDRTAPQAEIRFTCTADGYRYREEGETVYFASDVIAELVIRDLCGDKEMPVDSEAYSLVRWSGLGEQDGSAVLPASGDYAVRKDGRERFGAYGRDRAGNGLTVREVFPEGLYMEGADVKTKPYLPESVRFGQTDAENCAPGTVIVRDTVNPVLSAAVSMPAGNPAGIDSMNKILYFGNDDSLYEGGEKAVRVLFAVEDENGDENRIKTLKAYEEVTGDRLCEEIQPGKAEYEKAAVSREGSNILFEIVRKPGGDMPDGVYRFGIEGTDKAGNPLVKKKGGEQTDNGFGLTEGGGTEGGSGDATETGLEAGKFMTDRIVADTVAPTGEIRVRNGKGEEYCVMQAHREAWVTRRDGFMPFRREKEAEIGYSLRDTSPSAIAFRILTTSGALNGSGPDGTAYSGDPGGTVRIRGGQIFRIERLVLRDRAGNCSAAFPGTADFYLDTQLPEADIDIPSVSVRAVAEITARDPAGQALYGSGVQLEITAQDPDAAGGGSGLREVSYDLFIDGEAVRTGELLYSDSFAETIRENEAERGKTGPVYQFSGSLDIPSGGIYESNRIEVEVRAEDNAGNRSDVQRGGSCSFGIDTVKPRIQVTYDNNDVVNSSYLSKNRKARIIARERNFDASKIRINAPGAQIGGWRFLGKGGNGDADEWGMELQFESDGKYTLDISGTDALGNPAAVEYNGEAPRTFTVDRTPPVIDVIWDNTDVRNGKYYNRARRAVIRITDLSFDPRGVKILPFSGGFRKTGESSYETEVIFDEEGEWKLNCACTDLAGNTAVPVDENAFVVDMTPPRMFFDKDTVREMGAYGGEISPQVRWEEENPSDAVCYAVWNNLTCGGQTVACRTGSGSGESGLLLPDPPGIREADGICVLSAGMCDLAGNRTYIRRNLSVNRFGSTYDISGAEESAQVAGENHVNEEAPLVVTEYNVSPLVRREVILFRNGRAGTLTEGEEYEVTQEKNAAGMKYVYRIEPKTFQKEGRYSLLINSEDETGRLNSSTGRFRQNGSGREESFSPTWTVDRTPPTIKIAGVDMSRHRFVTDRVPVSLIPGDNLGLASLVIMILDDQGAVLKEQRIDKEELREILDKNRGEVPLVISASEKWQTLVAVAADDTGNLSEGMTAASDPAGTETVGQYRLLVSASPIVHLYRSGALPGAAFLVLAAAAAILFRSFGFSFFSH